MCPTDFRQSLASAQASASVTAKHFKDRSIKANRRLRWQMCDFDCARSPFVDQLPRAPDITEHPRHLTEVSCGGGAGVRRELGDIRGAKSAFVFHLRRNRVSSRQFLRIRPLTVRGDRISPKAGPRLHYYRRTEPGFDGLAGTNLRFSEQGGP
jgi:hypothetical protein